MNIETGQVKRLEELTEQEKKSGKWVELPEDMRDLEFLKKTPQPDSAPIYKSKSDRRRDGYMNRVEEKRKLGVNV